jgi:hypothetical protein
MKNANESNWSFEFKMVFLQMMIFFKIIEFKEKNAWLVVLPKVVCFCCFHAQVH